MARRTVVEQTTFFNRIGRRVSSVFFSLKNRIARLWARIVAFIRKWPFASFFIVLAILLILIVLGSTIFAPKPLEEKKGAGVKEVEIFKIGEAPKITVSASVEKSGVIKVVAQAPGIVSAINVVEGQHVEKGTNLIGLSSNYQGGNAASLQAQIAKSQYQLAKDTFEGQKDIIAKSREVARKSDANADELRDISARSIDETRSLLDQNQSLLNSLNASLEASPAADPATVTQIEGQRIQLQGAINQLRSMLRQTEFQASGDKPPAQLSDLGRDITLKQLEIQEKTLEAGKETARLSYMLASVAAAQMFPAAPFSGTVERVHVRIGEAVNPGMTLVTLNGDASSVTLVAGVPRSVSQNVSKIEESEIIVNGQTIKLMPSYVTNEAINGQLYGVIYQMGDGYNNLFTEGAFVEVRVPIGGPDTNAVVPFIPLDAVFQTQAESIVYVNVGGVAQARKVNLGQVQGSFVAVEEGIGGSDEIILSRNVVEGDKVQVAQ